METVHRQKCPACGGTRFQLYHYLREMHHDRVFLECADCGHFAARLIVHAYIEPDDASAYRDFLKTALAEDNTSGKKTLEDHQVHVKRARLQFEHVKQMKSDNETLSLPELFIKLRILEDG